MRGRRRLPASRIRIYIYARTLSRTYVQVAIVRPNKSNERYEHPRLFPVDIYVSTYGYRASDAGWSQYGVIKKGTGVREFYADHISEMHASELPLHM